MILISLVVFVLACPDPKEKQSEDDGAEGDTGAAAAACEDEQARIRALEVDLAECRAPK